MSDDVPLIPRPPGALKPGAPKPVEPDLVFVFRPLADERPLKVRIRNLLKFALRCERFRLIDIDERPKAKE